MKRILKELLSILISLGILLVPMCYGAFCWTKAKPYLYVLFIFDALFIFHLVEEKLEEKMKDD
jgi:hypothetical protein